MLNLKYSTPWFIKGFNALNHYNLKHYLDFDLIIQKSKKRTSLQYLGDDFKDEPVRVLLESAQKEASLSSFGAFVFREKLIGQLSNRLRAEYWFRKKPEILEQELLPIYLVTGLQRTGTTRLQRLLSQQKSAKGLYTWEALNPSPIKSINETHKRIRLAKISAKSVQFMAPNFHDIHPIKVNDVEEDILLLDVGFMSTAFEAILHLPTYSNWLENNYSAEAYRYEAKLLRLLQFNSNQKFWVLKSPHHLEYLKEFNSVLNPVKIIWTHREIEKTVPSLLSMIYYSRGLFRNQVDMREVKDHWMRKMIRMTSLGVQESSSIKSKLMHINYNEWTQNEKQSIANILEIPKSEIEVIHEDYRSVHQYNLKDFDLTKKELEHNFRTYLKFISTNKI